MEDPMDYLPSEAKEKPDEITINDIISFLVNFIQMDQLGRLANAHVVVSDSSPQGVKDPLCIKLAEAFCLAVDFPKTGIIARMPEMKPIQKYPDFMERNGLSYKSEKVIGIMYRKCKNFSVDEFIDKIELNDRFVLNGHEKYLEDAIKAYGKYRNQFETLLNEFQCKTESELLLGISLSSAYQQYDAKNNFKTCAIRIRHLWSHMRERFFEEFGGETEVSGYIRHLSNGVYLKASAWYVACYTNKLNSKLRILSFPWILEDLMSNFEIKDFNTLSNTIVGKYFEYKTEYDIISCFEDKIELKNYLSAYTKLNLCLVGYNGLLLFGDKENQSELIVNNQNEKENEINIISNNLRKQFYKVQKINNKITNTSSQDGDQFVIRFNSRITILNFFYVRRVVFNNPFLLPLLYVIAHFARQDRILLSFVKETDLLFDCIHYFKKKIANTRVIDDFDFEKELLNYTNSTDLDEYDEWIKMQEQLNINSFNKVDIGKLLLEFYYDVTYEKVKFKSFNEEQNKFLVTHFSKIFNLLSKLNDISQIWNILDNHRQLPKQSDLNEYNSILSTKTSSIFQTSDRKRLFVRNLPLNTNLYELMKLFTPYGRVKEHLSVVKDKNYAFICFYNKNEAQNAKNALNNALFKNKRIEVSFAKAKVYAKF